MTQEIKYQQKQKNKRQNRMENDTRDKLFTEIAKYIR